MTEYVAQYRLSHCDRWKRFSELRSTYDAARDDADRLAIIMQVGSPDNVRVVRRTVTEEIVTEATQGVLITA